jgi:ubiquinone/menaquinone biosynthesis C-methylase UbiE
VEELRRNGAWCLGSQRDYVLGYTDEEFRRLERQGLFFRDLTENVLRRAGLADGMRVLDLGCGVDDVALLAAELVGPSGAVLGIDRSPESVETANRRAVVAEKSWVRFATADLDGFETGERSDALIGRLVLLYLRDPSATLRRLSAYLSRRGIVAFHEMCMPMTRSVPSAPLHDQCLKWIMMTFDRAGVEVDMGAKLMQTLVAAGPPAPGPDSRGQSKVEA